MAARLSVLAADGVQSAQLHLNPADMGPVAVQIVLEGQQARIEFQADQADTRAVLERSLPDLAAALRDSGLTLSGGGVFQQFAGQDSSAAQDRNETNGSRRSGRAGADALPDTRSDLPARTAALARPTQGVVDLYA
jgi:flagellar hook-length control protein FliK